jgi:glucosamine--fructose-6-phosphate aminotransferase (isomerizing)
MCGIIGYIGFRDPKEVLLDGLKRLEYRGYDSAGIAVCENGSAKVFRCEGRIENLERKLSEKSFRGKIGIGHTRWATHGAPIEINAHPHRIGSITLVHNGIIENYMDHKEAILMMGRQVCSDTDSEIVAHLFDLEVSRGRTLQQAMGSVLPRLKGSYAFVIMNDLEPDLFVGVRNGAPLLVGIDPAEKEAFISSDAQAILHRTRNIVYLEDGQFALVNRDKLSVFSFTGERVSYAVKQINWSAEQMDKSGYRHYMLKEIHEQSFALTNTLEGNVNHATGIIAVADLGISSDRLRGFKRVCIAACGSARHAGLIGKYYLERFARLPVDVDFASEFRYRNPVIDSDTLVLLISQSGETADTLAALRESRRRKITTLSICNVRESTLARESDCVIYSNAGPEIGVASTKAFTTQIAVLYALSIELGYLNGTLSDDQARELTADIVSLPILVEKTLQIEGEVEKIALEYEADRAFFYIARGVQFPVALEGALKLKEISYLHAEGYAAGELKHGPIALIDRSTVTLALASVDKPYSWDARSGDAYFLSSLPEKIISNVQEVRARGGHVLGITTEGDQRLSAVTEKCIYLPKASWAVNPILFSIPLQLFAYYTALQRGTDVDKPRNLAKSVTVE